MPLLGDTPTPPELEEVGLEELDAAADTDDVAEVETADARAEDEDIVAEEEDEAEDVEEAGAELLV